MSLKKILRLTIFLVLWTGTKGFSIEPLQGPEVGFWSVRQVDESGETLKSSKRSLSLDIPVPIALFNSMPFITGRILDHSYEDHKHSYEIDQRFGLGLIHHADEGDPAWRLDYQRIGTFANAPSSHTKLSLNLAKPFPFLKLDTSDEVLSWIAIHYVTDVLGRKSMMIPEFAWIRNARDGMVVELVAPERFVLGVRGHLLGVYAGVQQNLRRWDQTSTAQELAQWEFKRESFLRISFFLNEYATLSAAITRELESLHPETTAGLSLQWIPNP